MEVSGTRKLRALLTFDLAEYIRLVRSGARNSRPHPLDRAIRFAWRSEAAPYPLPWFFRGLPPAMARLRRVAIRNRREALSAPAALLHGALWPLVAAATAAGLTLRYRQVLRRESGRGFLSHFPRCLFRCLRWNVAPTEYYGLRLFRLREGRRVPLHVFARETWPAHQSLRQAGRDTDTLNNKALFAAHCRDQRLPTARTLLIARPGREVEWIEASLPFADLFLKPLGQYGAKGAQVWRFDPASGRWRNGDLALASADLVQHLSREPCLLQERHRNHSALRGLAPEGLATFRVVTLRFPDGDIQVVGALLKIPVGSMHIDAYRAGGLAAPVEIDTGRLGPAQARDLRRGFITRHPNTGTAIDGFTVPQWNSVLALARRAHATLPAMGSIGWDIALTDGGPLLIEGNVAWDFDLLQLALGHGVGETCFLDWLEAVGLRDKAVPAAPPEISSLASP